MIFLCYITFSYYKFKLEYRKMKKKIHPEYHEIKVVMTDGSEFKTRSTFGKPGETLKLDVDPISHPAWTGGNAQIREDAGQVARFKKKFGNIKV
tara:strand:- start:48 stop:329 length:282 start_codon:yes stop_codon:yes gene_type:complete